MSKDSSSTATDAVAPPSKAPLPVGAANSAEPPKKTVPWSPLAAVLYTIVVYIVTQVLASFLIIIYPHSRGWSQTVTDNWLNNSVTAQFFYVLLAEALTFGAIWWYIRWRKSNLRAVGWKMIRARDPLFTLIGFVVYYIAYVVLLAIATHFIPSLNVNQKQQLGFNSASGSQALILTFLSLVVLPPLVEETVFRGFLFTGLRNKFNWKWAAVITSIIFAAAHLELGSGAPPLWVAALDTFTLSLVLCTLRQKTDSLWAGILLHALKNGIAFISLFILHVN